LIGYEGSCIYCNGEPQGFGERGQAETGKKRQRDLNMCAIKMPYASKLMLQEL